MRAPPARAAVRAAFVIVVAPSCETPITSPSVGGSSESSNACAAIGPPPGSPAARHAARRISTAPRAACSDVPQPVTMTGATRPRRLGDGRGEGGRVRPVAGMRGEDPAPATAGSAAIMSVMWYGGPDRRLGVSVDAHGSGGPGSGAVGSKAASAVIGRG